MSRRKQYKKEKTFLLFPQKWQSEDIRFQL